MTEHLDTQPAPATAAGRPGRGAAACAGVAATGVALGVGELLAGLSGGIPSPVSAVGSAVIPYVPPTLESWAIRTFGTSDKLVLTVGVVVVSLAVGAYVGVRSRHHGGAAPLWFGLFGVAGLVAMLGQPLVSPPLSATAVIAVVVAGVATLRRLLRSAAPAGVVDPDARRRFVGGLAGAGLGAVASAWVGRWLLAPPASEGTGGGPVALPSPDPGVGPVPDAADLAVDGLTPIVVPNGDFYRIDTALVVPRIDPETWRLRIHGMVDRELELDLRDLVGRDLVERYVTIACVSNEVGDDLVGNAAWLGVPLRQLLDQAGVRDGATQIVGRSVDGWTAGFPTELAFDGRGALLALGMNGEPLPREHGYPARLIVPGLYGYVSATKWLTEIELTTWEGFDAYWVPRGWSKRGPIKTQSRIDVPRADTRITAGPIAVAGVAWAPTRGISRVEVQADDGPWQPAELSEPLTDDAWVQWRTEVDLGEGVHYLRVRATDGDGETQTDEVAPPRPDGATGWHTVRVFT
jgi:DMSO/TMAO reductase YedYZ molybdopterin-dependent catalytic subunit